MNKKIIIIIVAALFFLAGFIPAGFFLEKKVISDLSLSDDFSADRPLGAQYPDKEMFLPLIEKNVAQEPLKKVSGLVVPHHLLAIDMIAAAYASLAANDYQEIVLLSPDHYSASSKDVAVSRRDLATAFGVMKNDDKLSESLASLPNVADGDFFYRDHGIGAQLPFIKYYFPQAKIVVLSFKPETSRDELDKIYEILSRNLPDNSLIIQSTDFSHYLSPEAAERQDKTSLAVLESGDSSLVWSLNQPDNIDSKAAMYLQSRLQRERFSATAKIEEQHNSQEYSKEKLNSTTSYISAFFIPQEKLATASYRLLFVGDIMLSRYIGELMARKDDYLFPYQNIIDYLKGADMAIGNLESPIAANGQDAGHLYSFRADPKNAAALKEVNFQLLTLANNHIFDYGPEAMLETLRNLETAGISYAGAGDDFSVAHQGTIKELGDLKIGFLAYTDLLPRSQAASDNQAGFSYLDTRQMVLDIENLKKRADLVVVSFHFGQEYQTVSNKRQQEIAAAAVKSGADLIIGHHPHVPQEISQINGVTVAYSLGNFIFDQNFSPETASGLILEVIIEDGKIKSAKPLRIVFNRQFQPSLKEGN